MRLIKIMSVISVKPMDLLLVDKFQMIQKPFAVKRTKLEQTAVVVKILSAPPKSSLKECRSSLVLTTRISVEQRAA